MHSEISQRIKQETSQIRIPANQQVTEPIYWVHRIRADRATDTDSTAHANSEVDSILNSTGYDLWLEPGSSAQLIEMYVSGSSVSKLFGTSGGMPDNTSRIHLGAGARLHHILLQYDTGMHQPNNQIQVHLEAQSHYLGHSILQGATRNTASFNVDLMGPEASCTLYALAIGRAKQEILQEYRIRHAAPQTQSEIYSRGIAFDQSHLTFKGLIRIPKSGLHTSARLENKNLLLSSQAKIDTQPMLRIDQPAVQCSHGATVGHLDTEALFYLQSRGLPKKEAEALLIETFVQGSLLGLPTHLIQPILALIHEQTHA